jgi:tRNA dimethylallyltransferase
MRAIGVPPLIALLDGQVEKREAIERWRLDTRRYAKRQGTWFRHQHPDWPRG